MRKELRYFVLVMLAMGSLFLIANTLFAGTVDLPKTGQITCYDEGDNVIPCAGTGQDGDIQAGATWPNPRFTDNGDGTITDNLTGLMWLKDADCLGFLTWQAALDKVADLNANPGSYTCGGYTGTYSDWALPNVNELQSLYNAAVTDSGSWLNLNGFSDVQSFSYWSSTTYANDTGYAWGIYMANGFMGGYNKSISSYVWAVRAVKIPPAAVWKTGQTQSYGAGDDGALQRGVGWPDPRLADNGDGTVTDNLTGLMWLKDANCFGSMSWQTALAKVADLNANPGSYTCGDYAAGYTDWRLPNRKELLSLTDFSQYSLALPAGHPFANVQSGDYWSSTTNAHHFDAAWVVIMDHGIVNDHDKSDDYYVWPVRAGQSGTLLYVDNHGQCGQEPCYQAINLALEAAEDGSLIKVADGTYSEAPDWKKAGMVTISGGWKNSFADHNGTSQIYSPVCTGGGSIKLQPSVTVVPR